MKIQEIDFFNFRNLKNGNLKLSDKINVFYGKNAQGKTSILEALYFSSTGVSFRTKKTNEILKYNTDSMFLNLSYEDYISTSKLSIRFENKFSSKKEFFFNKKKISQSEFYGKVNVIAYIPEDIVLINGSPKSRREFFDMEISQANRGYLEQIKVYNKLLKIRNKYLKENKINSEEFKIYEQEFIEYGSRIIYSRLEYIKSLSIMLNLLYRKLFNSNQELMIDYESFILKNQKLNVEIIKNKFKKEIGLNREKEKKYKFSLVGPHKDDYKFMLNGYEAKMNASQGEKKSIIFSLKLSEIEMIKKLKKENPIIIIDDITSYFDKIRRNSVIEYLLKKDIQVIISSTEKLDIVSENFYVEEGIIEKDAIKKN